MRLIAKAALGALAFASFAAVAAMPSSAAVEVVTPNGGVVIAPNRDACLRAPEFRPAFCFRHDREWWRDRFAFNDRDRMWRERDRMRREEAERRAELNQQYYDMHRQY